MRTPHDISGYFTTTHSSSTTTTASTHIMIGIGAAERHIPSGIYYSLDDSSAR